MDSGYQEKKNYIFKWKESALLFWTLIWQSVKIKLLVVSQKTENKSWGGLQKQLCSDSWTGLGQIKNELRLQTHFPYFLP